MNVSTAHITLRYRPGADVLTGEIDLRELGDGTSVTESPDADSTFVWTTSPTAAGIKGTEYLSSFHLVHASARLAEPAETVPLPACLVPLALGLIAAAGEALSCHDSPMAKLRAWAESSTELPIASLQRSGPGEPLPMPCVDPEAALVLAASLTRFSAAVHRRPPADERVDHLSRLLHELSSAVSSGHGRTAPGTAAATRAAAHGDMPLTVGQQRALEQALRDLNEPASWPQVSESLDRLSQQIERSAAC